MGFLRSSAGARPPVPAACEKPVNEHHQRQTRNHDAAALEEQGAEWHLLEGHSNYEASDYACDSAYELKQNVERRKGTAQVPGGPTLWLLPVYVQGHMLITPGLIHAPLALGLGMHLPRRVFLVAPTLGVHNWVLLMLADSKGHAGEEIIEDPAYEPALGPGVRRK